MGTHPTTFVPSDVKGLAHNTATVKLPAPDAIKGGFAMLIMGVVGFVLRRDVEWSMRWMDR